MNRSFFPALAALLLALLALTSCQTLGLKRSAADDSLHRLLPQDTMVVVGTLENGLRYYVRRNAEPPNRVELRLVVNAGSVLENEDQLGLAHVVEHMAFNGTRNFARHELVDYLESVGMRFGPDINAYTSFDETVYMLTLPTDSAGVVEQGFQILEDWAHGITFDPEEVERERGVVIEEWRLGQGAGTRMQKRHLPALLQASRYAQRLPIGTRESLESFDVEALQRFYRDWYRPDLMAVVVVGDVDPAEMEARIREHFAGLTSPERPRPRREFRVPDHEQTLFSIASDPEATGASISLYLKQPARAGGTPAAYRRWVVESLAMDMLVNRLHDETQKPQSAFLNVSSFHGRFLRPLHAYALSVTAPQGGTLRGIQALLTEAERVARHGFTPSELEREKAELMRMMDQRFREREKTTSSEFAAEYASHYLYGGALVDVTTEFEQYQRFIPEVRIEKVNAVARGWLSGRNRVVLVNAPANDPHIPTEEELTEVVRSVRRRGLSAFADGVSEAPLLSPLPQPGQIVSEREITEIGTTEWTLANGVRVLVKPTDFREDEVLLAARSPGGMSLVEDEDYFAALTASAVVQAGGIGSLSQSELRKRMAGKLAVVGAEIGELHEGLTGGASPRDLETMFQLVYLRFTAPRLDSAAIQAYQEQARTMLLNRGASPESAFMDTLLVTLAQHHPRARPPSAARFDSLDIERSFELFRERFADASDFTFYIVGNFAVDSIRPLVERYLGSLPSLGRQESAQDVGIRAPTGVVRREVYRGLEPKARTQIVFNGTIEYEQENLTALTALAEVLQLRLREVLREDLAGTYGVGVSASAAREPRPRYRISLGFGAAPERLEELTGVVFAQIDSLNRYGPQERDLAKVREMQVRSREVELRENRFWLSQLLAYDQNGWDPRGILTFEQRARGVTARMVQEAARRYLDTGNYVRVSLYPEDSVHASRP
ncbi:insulinase family protein [soil metagenome]